MLIDFNKAKEVTMPGDESWDWYDDSQDVYG